MHRGLQIFEIVESICSHLGSQGLDSGPQRSGSNALAALARACRAFHDPALSALWYHQRSLLHILQCMPNDIWSTSPTEFNIDSLDLVRPIMPADWERPMVYLHRIKSLVCLNDAHIYGSLRMSFPRDFFCPNLQALTWSADSDEAFPEIFMFLAPRIRQINLALGFYNPDMTHLSLLPVLGRKYPHLTHVRIGGNTWGGTYDQHLLRCIADFVRNLTCLEVLSLPMLDRETFQHIAQLPSLSSLLLRDAAGFIPDPRSSTEPGFTGLRSLQIDTISPQFMTAFLRRMTSTPLSSFDVTLDPLPDTPYLPDVYAALETHCSHSALRSIDISCVNGDNRDHGDIHVHTITGPILRHLFRFTNLTEVCLAPSTGFDLDDGTVIEMARAWPSIERLELVAPAYRADLPNQRVTLAALPVFALHCPHLEFLHILLDASVVPDTAGTPHTQEALIGMDVGYSTVSNASSVTVFLAAVFPKLSDIRTDHDGDRYPIPSSESLQQSAPFHEIWKEVETSLLKEVLLRGD
ncbi:hypothetical protein FB451DRAFT_1121975 [Mycena latifolia]|nr:hypothetical protein FB451DRAFT_1121975 [Mycena latifolia]